MKRLLSAALAITLCLGLFGCAAPAAESKAAGTAGSKAEESKAEDPATGEVTKVTMIAGNGGNDSNTEYQKWVYSKFDEKYAGQYQMEIEWVPGVAEDVRAKMKMLNAANDLPAVVGEMGAEPAFADLMMKNNRLVDLKPYFDADEEWKRVSIPESVEYNTKDGKMYSAPNAAGAFAGMYYNKELFTKAGIETFPETLEEFWAACDKLQAEGITPISLHTTETGWCPMIFATAQLALTDSGKTFAKQMYPTNFDTPEMRSAFETIKRLFTYSTTDAVGGNYALAANNFASGNTAMIPNGPWMISGLNDPQFAPEGFAAKVGYAAYPGKVMITTGGYEGYGLGVSVDVSEEAQKGAIEYIKFLSTPEIVRESCVIRGDIAPEIPLTEEDFARMDPIMVEYSDAVAGLVGTIPNYQGKWDPITQNEVIPTELVNYITDKTTLDDLFGKMNAAAEKYVAENQ